MLIRADTFGGDSHNFPGWFSHIIILSGKPNKRGSSFRNRFAWNCFTTSDGPQQNSNMLKNSPFLNHPCCCCHEWVYLPVAGTDLVFCFACSEHNPYFHFLYLSCFEYTFTFFLVRSQSIWFPLVISGVLHFGQVGNSCSLPAACIDRYWYFIATAAQHTGTRQVITAGGEENSQRQSFSCHCLW